MATTHISDSILESVKEDLGVAAEYAEETPFDNSLIRYINTTLGILWQLGVGPTETPFEITGPDETWEDFLGEELSRLSGVRTYVSGKVKSMFDKPTSQALIQAEEAINSELSFRLSVAGDKTV